MRRKHTYRAAQTAALQHPCRLAVNTLHASLRHQLSTSVSLVVSINTGYE